MSAPFDFQWLQARLDATDIDTLLAELDAMEESVSLQILISALQLATPALKSHKPALAAQLHARLWHHKDHDPAIAALYDSVTFATPSLRLVSRSLYPAGVPLEQHTAPASLVDRLSDKRWVIQEGENLAYLWHPKRGILATMREHSIPIKRTWEMPEGWFFTLDYDGLLCRWSQDGHLLDRFDEEIEWLALLPNGRIFTTEEETVTFRRSDGQPISVTPATRSHFFVEGERIIEFNNQMIRVWSFEGELIATLPQGVEFMDIAGLHDGRIACLDNESKHLGIWTLDGTYTESTHPYDSYTALRAIDGVRFLTFSDTRSPLTAQLWDYDGNLIANLEHGALVHGWQALEDGRFITWCRREEVNFQLLHDPILRIWDENGHLLHVLDVGRQCETVWVFPLADGNLLIRCWSHVLLCILEGKLLYALPAPFHWLFPVVGDDGIIMAWGDHGTQVIKIDYSMMLVAARAQSEDTALLTGYEFPKQATLQVKDVADEAIRDRLQAFHHEDKRCYLLVDGRWVVPSRLQDDPQTVHIHEPDGSLLKVLDFSTEPKVYIHVLPFNHHPHFLTSRPHFPSLKLWDSSGNLVDEFTLDHQILLNMPSITEDDRHIRVKGEYGTTYLLHVDW